MPELCLFFFFFQSEVIVAQFLIVRRLSRLQGRYCSSREVRWYHSIQALGVRHHEVQEGGVRSICSRARGTILYASLSSFFIFRSRSILKFLRCKQLFPVWISLFLPRPLWKVFLLQFMVILHAPCCNLFHVALKYKTTRILFL